MWVMRARSAWIGALAAVAAMSVVAVSPGAAEEPVAAPAGLRIIGLDADATEPVPGRTVTLRARVRNAGPVAVAEADVQFYHAGRAFGAPVAVGPLAPDEEVTVATRLRPAGIGRFTFDVTASPRAAGPGAPGAIIGADTAQGGFTISALPGWWARLDTELAAAERPGMRGSRSVMPALAGHAMCSHDIRADMLIQQHGEALMTGIRALPANRQAAEAHFTDALAALSDMAKALYCIDFDQLQYWDRAIAGFWHSMAASPDPDMNFEAALIATWNPALLVLDAVQYTGHSQIVRAYQDLGPHIDAALQAWPTDSYGAAWLDAFGTGALRQARGASAMDNLTMALEKPALLGLGTCPLIAHAAKALPDTACIEGLAAVSQACTKADPGALLAGLHDHGLFGALVAGNAAAARSRAAPVPAGTFPAIVLDADSLGYFGTPVAVRVAGLCSALAGAGQPRGLQGMADALGGIDLQALGGCGFAIATASLGEAGRQGDRAVLCLKRMGGPGPAGPPLTATELRFPTACTVSNPPKHGQPSAKGFRQAHGRTTRRAFADSDTSVKITLEEGYPDGNEETVEAIHKSGSKIVSRHKEVDGQIVNGERTETGPDGEIVFEGKYVFDDKGRVVEAYERVVNPDGSMVERNYARDRNGNVEIDVRETALDGTSRRYKVTVPTTPGPPDAAVAVDCPETAAEARAQATFNCLFADGTTEAAATAGPAPVINILDPGALLPAECDAIDPGSFWGSSTGSGGYDPPEWRLPGGPMMLRSFVPEIDGVIDPPRDWIGIPRPGDLPD